MINLFIPPSLIILSGLALFLTGASPSVSSAVMVLVYAFNAVVFLLRLAINPLIHADAAFLEFSDITILLSAVLSVASALLTIHKGAVKPSGEDRRLHFAFLSAFSILSLQSATLPHFALFSYASLILMILFSWSFGERGFNKVRILTGISLSFAVMAAGIAYLILSPSAQNVFPAIVLPAFSLLFQTGGFPLNVFSYDYLSEKHSVARAVWLPFIALPAAYFLAKSLIWAGASPAVLSFLFSLESVSSVIMILFLFSRKRVPEMSAGLVLLLSTEIPMFMIMGIITGNPVFTVYSCAIPVFGFIMAVSLDSFGAEKADDLKGAFIKKPLSALAFLISAFSISFVPPSFGFSSRLELVGSLASGGHALAAVSMLIAFSIEAFILLRVLFAMFLVISPEEQIKLKRADSGALLLAAAVSATVLLMLMKTPLTRAAEERLDSSFSGVRLSDDSGYGGRGLKTLLDDYE